MSEGNLSELVVAGFDGSTKWQTTVWRRVHVAKAFRALGFAAIGFFFTCASIALVRPDPLSLYAAARSEKLEIAKRWASASTVAAFGSSHVATAFDPRVFDAALQAGDRQPRSVNLAVLGGGQIEQSAMGLAFEQLQASSEKRPKQTLLFLEANIGANFTQELLTQPRSINIYGWSNLKLALQFADPSLGPGRAVGRAAYAASAAALNFLNTGMLSSKIFPPSLDAKMLSDLTVDDRRGLTSPPQGGGIVEAQLPSRTTRVSQGEVTPGLCASWTRLTHGDFGEHNRIFYIVTPSLSDLESVTWFPAALVCDGRAVPILNVAEPAVHPELYSADLWFDATHLNEKGAIVYTKLIAQASARELGETASSYLEELSNVVH
jgi:hypothetical protein